MLSSQLFSALIQASWQTLYIVSCASFLAILLGLLLGVALYEAQYRASALSQVTYRVLNVVVNIGRSIPFIILLVALIPLTRWLVGTSIGTNAAIVSLVAAAIPFYARLVHSALIELPQSLTLTAQALAASHRQRLIKILLPEAATVLIRSATLTIIAIVGYSAMAGTVGGGGLGQLAIDYGYQRFNVNVIVSTIVILVLLVQIIQWLGDYLASRKRLGIWLWVLSAACIFTTVGANLHVTPKKNELRLGVMSGVEADCARVAARVAWQKYHLRVKIVTFDDYALPNRALADGDIDANLFQHVPFLKQDIGSHHYPIRAIANTFVYPIAFYSNKIHQLNALKAGDVVAVANDASNQARALRLLAAHGVITLRKTGEQLPSVHDITSNPKQLRFKALDTATLPRMLSDATIVAINNAFVKAAHVTQDQVVVKEDANVPYINVLVVRTKDAHQSQWGNLIKALHSKPYIAANEKAFPGAVIAWR